MPSFAGKVALITGASSGIGKALSEVLLSHGAKVVLLARRLDRLQAICKKLDGTGENCVAIQADVTDRGSLETAVTETLANFGRLDLVFANAGFGITGQIESLPLGSFKKQFDTNVWGVLHTIQTTVEEVKKTKGQFIITGSIAGFVSLPGGTPYSMSKFAIKALSDSLYHELKPFGVSVTHIAPGFVESEIRLIDNEGTFRPERKDPIPSWLVVPTDKAVKQIFRAVKKRKREVVVTGHGKIITFLQRHFPGLFALLISTFGAPHRKES